MQKWGLNTAEDLAQSPCSHHPLARSRSPQSLVAWKGGWLFPTALRAAGAQQVLVSCSRGQTSMGLWPQEATGLAAPAVPGKPGGGPHSPLRCRKATSWEGQGWERALLEPGAEGTGPPSPALNAPGHHPLVWPVTETGPGWMKDICGPSSETRLRYCRRAADRQEPMALVPLLAGDAPSQQDSPRESYHGVWKDSGPLKLRLFQDSYVLQRHSGTSILKVLKPRGVYDCLGAMCDFTRTEVGRESSVHGFPASWCQNVWVAHWLLVTKPFP